MKSTWIPLRDAIPFLKQVEPSTRDAVNLLLRGLRDGALRSKAWSATIYQSHKPDESVDEYEIPAKHWTECNFDPDDKNDGAVFYLENGRVSAYSISVDRDGLVGLRASITEKVTGATETSGQKSKRRGGRPGEHNWDAAFFYAGALIGITAQDAQPSAKQARVIEAVREYFVKVERSKPPHQDHIRNRVRALYNDEGGED